MTLAHAHKNFLRVHGRRKMTAKRFRRAKHWAHAYRRILLRRLMRKIKTAEKRIHAVGATGSWEAGGVL